MGELVINLEYSIFYLNEGAMTPGSGSRTPFGNNFSRIQGTMRELGAILMIQELVVSGIGCDLGGCSCWWLVQNERTDKEMRTTVYY